MAEVDNYWNEKEKSLRQRIKGKYLCRYLSGSINITFPRWGILFFTQSSLYFESYRNENWLSILSFGKKNKNTEEVFLEWPWPEIIEAKLLTKPSWWKLISIPRGRILDIEYKHESKRTIEKNIFLLTDNLEELEIFIKERFTQ
ncbi:MAG: hypothetical protein DRP57_10450 [Spirochaetes bacterium]|nr:MAG: hypothetical protein DRP57_10450 [Spirochaetota bacterium]